MIAIHLTQITGSRQTVQPKIGGRPVLLTCHSKTTKEEKEGNNYTWFFNGRPVGEADFLEQGIYRTGAAGGTLVIPVASASIEGEYTCNAPDNTGSNQSGAKFVVTAARAGDEHTGHITNTGKWSLRPSTHKWNLDKGICDAMVPEFAAEGVRVFDLGAGDGQYTRYLRKQGVNVHGYDGNEAAVKKGLVDVWDLSTLRQMEEPADWCLSLEVAEHLPPKFEDTLLKNYAMNCEQGIVLTWAARGQGGAGHFNERNKPYVAERMKDFGWKYDRELTIRVAKKSQFPHLRNNLMIFRK